MAEITTAPLANQTLILFEKERNHTTTPAEAGDNDYGTSTTGATVVCDIRDADGNSTAFDHIFVKCSDADTYELFLDGTSHRACERYPRPSKSLVLNPQSLTFLSRATDGSMTSYRTERLADRRICLTHVYRDKHQSQRGADPQKGWGSSTRII